METLDIRRARRLALARAGLLKPNWTGMPGGAGRRPREAAHAVIRRFGYLQLDTVAVAGARSHAIVLMSRLEGLRPELAEDLLRPGEPLFEYWGHEASWIPLELYPLFEFRRRDFARHPWWGDVIGAHPEVADRLRRRIRDHGPLRSAEMEGGGSRGWWDLKTAKKVATAMWSSGELAILERCAFQRAYDLAERVIPERWRSAPADPADAIERLVLLALDGHGWATTGTVVATWRLAARRGEVETALRRLVDRRLVVPCQLVLADARHSRGWIRPRDLELAERLEGVRPRPSAGVLLSPFDPLLWDRARVESLFGFHQVLEVFKPAPRRIYGYYCLPVLAGERLVARVDLKADRRSGRLEVLSRHDEPGERPLTARRATRVAVDRFAGALGLAAGSL